MFTFALAVFFLIITPGPGVLSAAGVGSAFGRKAGLAYVAGLLVGNHLVSLIVITGLAALILSAPLVRLILFALSTAYLGYLAFRIAFAGAKIAFITAASRPGFRSGIFLQLINPKAYAVNSALFSSFAFMPDSYYSEVFIKLAIFNAIWIPLHLLWLEAGIQLQKLALSDKATKSVNYAMATALTMVVLLSILSMTRFG